MQVATKRRFTIRQSPNVEPIVCATCGAATLTAEQAAVLFGIKQRAVFQLIETGAAHFAETEIGAVMICLTSLAEILENRKAEKTTGEAG